MPVYQDAEELVDAQIKSNKATRAFLNKLAILRLWTLYDAAKAICEQETPKAWAALYRAVADVPEGQRPPQTGAAERRTG